MTMAKLLRSHPVIWFNLYEVGLNLIHLWIKMLNTIILAFTVDYFNILFHHAHAIQHMP